MTRIILSSLAVAAVLAASAGGAVNADDDGPRPTDCPPKPKEYCLNSWKPKPVNPFESGPAAKKRLKANQQSGSPAGKRAKKAR